MFMLMALDQKCMVKVMTGGSLTDTDTCYTTDMVTTYTGAFEGGSWRYEV